MRLANTDRLLPVLLMTVLVGCSESSPKENTQVAAKVNDQEITVHQLNLAIGSMGEKALSADKKALQTAVLNNMIIQTLMEQEAEKADLDREPYVMQAMEAAKRRVLASAYMQQIATISPSITQEDIEKYYAANTDLFANRKLFVYEQVTVQSDSDNVEAVDKKVRQTQSLTDFTDWLQKKSIPYSLLTQAKTSENISQNLLKPLSTLDVGQVGFLKLDDGFVVIEVKDKQPQPVGLEMATPAIKQHLQQQQQTAQIQQTVSSLKSAAMIEYSKSFEPNNGSDTAESPEPVATDMIQESYIEKGLQGLE
nr:EpsD family peptidyl-prolyl cis-trans isomerase [Methylophaga sp.]